MKIAVFNERANYGAFHRIWLKHTNDVEYVSRTVQTTVFNITGEALAKLKKTNICYYVVK